MSDLHWTREELRKLVDLRAEREWTETQGEHAYIDLHLRVTPEVLGHLLDGLWIDPDGLPHRLVGFRLDEGLAYPELEPVPVSR